MIRYRSWGPLPRPRRVSATIDRDHAAEVGRAAPARLPTDGRLGFIAGKNWGIPDGNSKKGVHYRKGSGKGKKRRLCTRNIEAESACRLLELSGLRQIRMAVGPPDHRPAPRGRGRFAQHACKPVTSNGNRWDGVFSRRSSHAPMYACLPPPKWTHTHGPTQWRVWVRSSKRPSHVLVYGFLRQRTAAAAAFCPQEMRRPHDARADA